MRRVLFLLALAAACKSVDPDKGRFSCMGAEDCGKGWDCVAQFAGGALCFRSGECTTEECNGKDDSCDGRIDESFSGEGDACMTGALGPCGVGKNVCLDAGVACVSSYVPITEICNGIDDDCRSGPDDTFAFSSDNLNCGSCGHRCATGSLCVSSACREVNCADGIDNDGDGGTDCLDPACITVSCGMDGGFNCGARLDPIDAGELDGGTDAGEVDGGTDGGADAGEIDAGYLAVPACVPRESPCDDGADNDLDLRVDCSDSDCDGMACPDGGTCMNGSCR